MWGGRCRPSFGRDGFEIEYVIDLILLIIPLQDLHFSLIEELSRPGCLAPDQSPSNRHQFPSLQIISRLIVERKSQWTSCIRAVFDYLSLKRYRIHTDLKEATPPHSTLTQQITDSRAHGEPQKDLFDILLRWARLEM